VGLGNTRGGGLCEAKEGEKYKFKKEGELQEKKDQWFNFKKTDNV
jgi:hypothetical protein